MRSGVRLRTVGKYGCDWIVDELWPPKRRWKVYTIYSPRRIRESNSIHCVLTSYMTPKMGSKMQMMSRPKMPSQILDAIVCARKNPLHPPQ